ncbi:hypothetical protein [Brevibacillus sp. DP1.3A]|uniref:hypothetical protein n=1 Tax=Brevibacillus sp. DP1.3A TaxID=2738867 RepID=UPI00156B056C|nr:hypothetical protein [Brevibacillus sp. DP1.3A]UED74922.1 hypothetical protein HP399_030290 [Brevibacillus sp. DP1.3A]
MKTASEILSIISNGSFLENVFNKDVDWDAKLDARDSVEFDTAWSSSYKKVDEIDPSENTVIKEIREFVFKQTFRITQNSELAGYASDDFGLISKAFENKVDVDIEFINSLWECYLQGKFPNSSMCE